MRDLAVEAREHRAPGPRPTSNSSSTAVAAREQRLGAGQLLGRGAEARQRADPGHRRAAGRHAPLGGGTLRIELGTWGAGPDQLHRRRPARRAIDIAVAATDTLADIRDKINAAGAGVTALVMTDASGSRLLIRSNATGAANAFRTTVTDDDGGNADAAGLSALAFDPSAGAAAMTQSQTAADAAATVNGLPVTSTSNTLTNIVDGLTLTLNAETTLTGPVTVNVVTDAEALKKTLTDFAAAYTAVVKLIAADTKYDPVAKKGAHPAGRQRRDRDAAPAAHPRRLGLGGLGGVRPPVRHRPRAAGRRLDDGQRDQARQRPWPTSPS